MGLAWCGNKSHPEGAPIWIVKAYGTTAELDNLAAKSGVTELPGAPAQALNSVTGLDRSASDWDTTW